VVSDGKRFKKQFRYQIKIKLFPLGGWLCRVRFVGRLLDGEKMVALCREFAISRDNPFGPKV
jgi:hypothetical protein